MRNQRHLQWVFRGGIVMMVLGLVGGAWPSQDVDSRFVARVDSPQFPNWTCRVLFEESHATTHSAGGRYAPFVDLVQADHCRVQTNRRPLTTDTLKWPRVLVIVNSLGWRGMVRQGLKQVGLAEWGPEATSVHTPEEVALIGHWVAAGGSLLLIADHEPCGAAAAGLARAFGVSMGNGYVEDQRHHDPLTGRDTFLVFNRENGLLGEHPITDGTNLLTHVDRVLTFTGQSLRGPAGSTPLLAFAVTAREYPTANSPERDGHSVAGAAQGLAFDYGQGRVVVLGEAAMLTAQVMKQGRDELRIGMSRADAQNQRFARNVLHWLMRAI